MGVAIEKAIVKIAENQQSNERSKQNIVQFSFSPKPFDGDYLKISESWLFIL